MTTLTRRHTQNDLVAAVACGVGATIRPALTSSSDGDTVIDAIISTDTRQMGLSIEFFEDHPSRYSTALMNEVLGTVDCTDGSSQYDSQGNSAFAAAFMYADIVRHPRSTKFPDKGESGSWTVEQVQQKSE